MSRINETDFFSVSAWLIQFVIIDQRFMPIFCMLFGAGFLILAEGRDNAPGFNLYIIRRMGILLGIGIIHAYFIWPGDILINYALCGPLLLLFYRMTPMQLILWGVTIKAVHFIFMQWPIINEVTFNRWLFDWWLEIGEAPMAEGAAYAGSYVDLLRYNAWRNQFIQWTAFFDYRVWNALGIMLIGMALYKFQVLSAAVSRSTYWRMLWISLLVGTPFLIYGTLGRIGAHETVGPFLSWQTELPLWSLIHLLGANLTAFAMLAGLLLWFTATPDSPVIRWLRAVGRMALSNYVMHSIIFLIIFGIFDWVAYDTLDPDDRLIWFAVIATGQIAFSLHWLRSFSMGPLEMVWRKLAGAGPRRSAVAGISAATS